MQIVNWFVDNKSNHQIAELILLTYDLFCDWQNWKKISFENRWRYRMRDCLAPELALTTLFALRVNYGLRDLYGLPPLPAKNRH